VSAPEPPVDEDDVLELGRQRSRWGSRLAGALTGPLRGLRYVAAAAACVGLAVAVLAALHPARRIDGAGRVALAAPQSSAPRTPPTPGPARPNSYDAPLRAVDALAHRPGALPSYVRQTSPAGACALVRVGRSPERTAERALARVTPRFRVRDRAAVLDQFTGLCALQLRADDVAGTVLVISVVSPTKHHRTGPYDRVQTGFELTPRYATKYAAVTTRGGFNVLVGATGRSRSLPTDRQLIELAHDPALTW
jgi:hypothetical protein